MFEFDSDAYTGNLLRDANGGPLFFRIALLPQGKLVAVPFHALLPPLQTLPDARAVKTAQQEGGTVSVLYLRFVAGHPVPARGRSVPPGKSATRGRSLKAARWR